MRWTMCLACSALFIGLAAAAAGETITTGALVRDMVDMKNLAEFPSPAYKTIQFSSYDRRSDLPGGPGWFENSDGFGNEPIPNFEAVLEAPKEGSDIGRYLICDIKGPGALVRQWTARINGSIEVYLDGAGTPVYDGPAEQFFRRPWDAYLEEAPVGAENLDGAFYQRDAAYCPIAFAQGCRIVWEGNMKELHFYHLQARLYEEGAQVATFTPNDLTTHAEDIKIASHILRAPDGLNAEGDAFTVKVGPGEWMEAQAFEGPGAIQTLKLRVQAEDRDLALRQTILHIAFDGYPWGQVQSPVGDFFGAAPGVNPYVSLPFSVHPDGAMVSRFFMPYAKKAVISFQNLGEQEVSIELEAAAMAYAWDAERSMHFRARWRIDHDLYGKPQDIPYLLANGQGVFVGAACYLLNPAMAPSPGGSWWGEGDEKIFVDDDRIPSTFGTGSEDYYNYAWSSPDIFIFPYCGQPVNTGPANRGFVTNYRWHILDPLPFEYRMSFYMELMPHEWNEGFSYGRMAYHYARPGLMDEHVTITKEDVRQLSIPPWMPKAIHAAQGGIFHQADDMAEDGAPHQIVEHPMWAGSKLYVWQPAEVGDTCTITFHVEKAGHYTPNMAFRFAPGSGSLKATIDGKHQAFGSPGGIISLERAHRTLLRVIRMEALKLGKGEHTITFELTGASPAGVGLDFLWLQPH